MALFYNQLIGMATIKQKNQIKALCWAVLALKSDSEALAFLKDLLTETEILEISQRLDIAKMLAQKVSYKNIEEKTWVSSTTIARVGKALKSRNRGYKIVIERTTKKKK